MNNTNIVHMLFDLNLAHFCGCVYLTKLEEHK